MRRASALVAAVSLSLSACQQPAVASERVVEAPAAERIAREGDGLQTAVFAGGCFWGIEAVFSHVKGVKSAVAGYHGGNAATANYKATNSGVTGHAEAVRVVYDPDVVRYDQLLRVFFSVGSQYRAALVPLSKEQRAVAAAYLKQMEASGKWGGPIVTEIESYRKFYKAEDYHQDFAAKNPRHGYIVRWDAPKVAALKRLYPAHYSASFERG